MDLIMMNSLLLGVWIIVCHISSVDSTSRFAWNPGQGKQLVTYTGTKIDTSDNESYLSGENGYWKVGDGAFLQLEDKTKWNQHISIRVDMIEICTVDLTDCRVRGDRNQEYCDCYSNIDHMFTFNLFKRFREVHSGQNLTAVIDKKDGSESLKGLMTKLPTIFFPLDVTLQVDSSPQQALVKDFNLMVDSNTTTLEFCVENIAKGSTFRLTVGAAVKDKQGGTCISLTTMLPSCQPVEVTFSYDEMRGLKRFAKTSGTIDNRACEATMKEVDDKFEDLEKIYIVTLLFIFALFGIACVCGCVWYYRLKRNIKISREHEIQGALDFDKFDSRVEDSQI